MISYIVQEFLIHSFHMDNMTPRNFVTSEGYFSQFGLSKRETADFGQRISLMAFIFI
jgi:hypothetical protein